MIATASIIWSHSPTRAVLCAILLAEPSKTWSIQALHAALPVGKREQISRHAIRANLYLLLDRHIVQLVHGKRIVTLRLTTQGEKELGDIVAMWRERGIEVTP